MSDIEPLEPRIEPEESNATKSEAKPKSGKQRSLLREIVETAILAILIFVLVRSVVLNFRVDGASMSPTLEGGEMVLVNRNAYQTLDLGDLVDWIPGVPDQHWFVITDWGAPRRGDVIVFTPPEPGDQKPYIKRVIGIPGDRVQIDTDGNVMVNGEVLDEDYIGEYDTQCNPTTRECDVTVPPGHVFALGDNRSPNGSEDSRYFGVISEDRIIGKAWIVYWPLDAIGTL